MKITVSYLSRFHLIWILCCIILIGLTAYSCEKNEIIELPPIKLDEGCDTLNVSYSTDIQKITEPCISCHNNSTHYAGINLEGYDNVKSSALGGKLVGSLKGSMSPYFKGSDCDYLKIQAWINQGTKNN